MDDILSLLASLESTGDRPALTFYRGRTRESTLSYAALSLAVSRVAGYLARTKGLHRGERIAIVSANRMEVPVLLLAAMRLGVAVVPLNPAGPPSAWESLVDHSGARFVFASADLLPRISSLRAEVVSLDNLLRQRAAEGPLPREDALGDALGVILYTSGTTGDPKGVAIRQRNLFANAKSMAQAFGLAATTQMSVLPLYHAHALGFGLMTALTTRGHLVFAERFDPFAWASVIRAEAVSVTSVVPALLPVLLQTRVHKNDVPSLEHVLVSSAPLSASLAREFERHTSISLLQGWGLSEYTNFACCLSPKLASEERRSLLYGSESTCVGGALVGTEVRVVNDRGEALGEGRQGELCIRGHSMMIGYYRNDAATRAVVDSEGWLRTGDLGEFRLHKGESIFFITGRIKEIIIRDAEKLSPIAIERRLLEHLPELEGRITVVGFSHRIHGEEVGAYVEMRTSPFELDLEKRLSEAVATLPLDERPKVILVGAAPVPRTHTGKIQRRKLLPLFASYEECRGRLVIAAV